MTLKGTIKYHKKIAEEFRKEAERVEYKPYVIYYYKCAEEHEQLVEWLTELVELREMKGANNE